MIQALDITNPNASEADERKQSKRTNRNNEINCKGHILNPTCAVVRVHRKVRSKAKAKLNPESLPVVMTERSHLFPYRTQ